MLLIQAKSLYTLRLDNSVCNNIYCLYLNFLLYFQSDTFIKEQSQAFYSNLKARSYGNLRIYQVSVSPPWSAVRISKFQLSCELSLPFTTLQYLTLHANYTVFALHLHKTFRHMQLFSEILFIKSSKVSQVLLSNMKIPV